MAEIMYCSTYGSDDPTRATFPFVAALGAIDAGHTARLVLMGEAVGLMKEPVANAVHGVGWPPLNELWTKVIDKGIPIHV